MIEKKKVLIAPGLDSNAFQRIEFALKHFNREGNALIFHLESAETGGSRAEEVADMVMQSIYLGEYTGALKNQSRQIKSDLKIRYFQSGSEDDLCQQAKYADLLIASEREFTKRYRNHYNSPAGSSFCPILVLPEDVPEIENVLFIHDKAHGSNVVFKEFCRAFPGFCGSTSVSLLILNSEDELSSMEEKMLIAYLKHQCKGLGVHHYTGEDWNRLRSLLGWNNHTLTVYSADSADFMNQIKIPEDSRKTITESPAFVSYL